MQQWLLLRPDEDGNPTRWLTQDELDELLANADEYGIDNWISPNNMKNADPNYWEEGSAMLLKVEAVLPKEVAYKYSI